MMHENDENLLEGILKTSPLPTDVVDEYEIRRSLFHGMGASGQLPAPMLVDMLRFLGYGRRAAAKPSGTDWDANIGRNVKILAGEYAGSIGVLKGKGPDHRYVVEVGGSLSEQSKINLELQPVDVVFPDKVEDRAPSGSPPIRDAEETDWSAIDQGAAVIVGEDCEDGEFLAFSEGVVRVKVNGRERVVNPDQVFAGT